MRIYETSTRSGLERCIADADIRYSTCPEALAIWDASGAFLDDAQIEIVRTVDGCYIRFADMFYIGEYEGFLDIHYSDDERSLEQHRAVVRSYFMRKFHIGEPEIKTLYAMFTDADVTADLVGGSVDITIVMKSDDPVRVDDIYRELRKKIPAHLGIYQTTVRVYDVPDLPLVITTGAITHFTDYLPEYTPPWQFERGPYIHTLGGSYAVEELDEYVPPWQFRRSPHLTAHGMRVSIDNLPEAVPHNQFAQGPDVAIHAHSVATNGGVFLSSVAVSNLPDLS